MSRDSFKYYCLRKLSHVYSYCYWSWCQHQATLTSTSAVHHYTYVNEARLQLPNITGQVSSFFMGHVGYRLSLSNPTSTNSKVIVVRNDAFTVVMSMCVILCWNANKKADIQARVQTCIDLYVVNCYCVNRSQTMLFCVWFRWWREPRNCSSVVCRRRPPSKTCAHTSSSSARYSIVIWLLTYLRVEWWWNSDVMLKQ